MHSLSLIIFMVVCVPVTLYMTCSVMRFLNFFLLETLLCVIVKCNKMQNSVHAVLIWSMNFFIFFLKIHGYLRLWTLRWRSKK